MRTCRQRLRCHYGRRFPFPPYMSSTVFPRYRAALLLMATLLAGPVACGPTVTRFELDTAQSKADSAQSRMALLEKEFQALQAEMKQLKTFGGPEHVKKIEAAAALRGEKSELEELLKDLEARLEHFTKETAAQHEALAKEKRP